MEELVDSLRDLAFIIDECQDKAHVRMISGSLFTEAADEIERLRAAGDALATGVRSGQWDDALDAWEEARRG